jgi:hypothetical protein
MSAQSMNRNPHVMQILLGSATADAEQNYAVLLRKSKLLRAYLTNAATLAESGSDFVSLEVKVGSTVIASGGNTTGQGAITADTPKALSVVDAAKIVAGLSPIRINYDETGTIALSNAIITLEWEPIESA